MAQGRAQDAVVEKTAGQGMDYTLKRSAAFTRFLDNGRVCIADHPMIRLDALLSWNWKDDGAVNGQRYEGEIQYRADAMQVGVADTAAVSHACESRMQPAMLIAL